ncbi:hypothetical protein CAR_c23710 [Carnobacterium sp. 17-4]|nr:hypothetical protein CAR_c23710 [Carnobacterium sp. 17-4]
MLYDVYRDIYATGRWQNGETKIERSTNKMKTSKLINMGKDYGHDAFDMAKDYLPSTHQLAKSKMKTDKILAKGVTKAMPKKVKRMGLAKLIILPLVGAVAGLLFAPKSGKELRTEIKDKFIDAKDTGIEKGEEWKEKGVEKAQDLKENYMDKTGTEHKNADSDESGSAHGNVHGTPAEPTEDQTIPADKLAETLDDLGYDSEEELAEEEK